MEFDDLSELYGEPYYGDAIGLPPPPPPELSAVAPPVEPSALEAAQYLPPPPPPDTELSALLAGSGGQSSRLNLVETYDAAHPPGTVERSAMPYVVDPNSPPAPFDPQLLGAPGPLPASLEAPPPVGGLPSLQPPAPPDAITDATGMPATGDIAGQPYAATLTPEQHYSQTRSQYADDPYAIPDLAEQKRYLDDLWLRDPIKAQDLELKHEYERRSAQAAERAKAERENYDREMANLADRRASQERIQKETDQIMAESQRIADTKIDPTGGVTGVRRIAGILGAIVGGLVQGRTGAARNAGLDAYMEIVNRGIDAQKADLANKRGALDFKKSALGEAYRRTGDMFLAEESVRQASFQHAIGLIDADAQNWDARGTQAMARAKTRAQLVQAQAKSLQDAREKRGEADLKEREQRRKEADSISQRGLDRANAAKAYSEIDRVKADKQTWSPDQLGILNPGLPKPPIAMSQADYTKWLGTQKSGEEYKSAARLNDPNERARELSVPGVVDDASQPILFQSKEEAGTVKQARTRGNNMVRKVDQLIQLITEHGHEPDFAKSKAWQQMQQIHASLTLESKEMDKLGALSESDIGLEHKKIGTNDPTQVRNTIPGLEQFRSDIVQGVNSIQQNTAVPAPGRKVADWTPPPLDLKPHQQSLDEIKMEKLVQDPELHSSVRRDVAAAQERNRVEHTPESAAALQDAMGQLEASQWQRENIARLTTAAGGPANDPEAIDARKKLANVAANGHTGTLRRLAKSGLESAGRAGLSTEDTSMGVR